MSHGELLLGGELGLTIAEAFDLLFTPQEDDSGEQEPSGSAATYAERRWFRRPRMFDASPDDMARARDDAELADTRLHQQLLSALPAWRKRLEAARSPGERISDSRAAKLGKLPSRVVPARHFPPKSPYDVFAMAGFLIDAAGIYHHIQPEKVIFENGRCEQDAASHRNDSPRHIDITVEDRELVRKAARAWRSLTWRPEGSIEPLATEITSEAVWADLEPLFESWFVVFAAYADADVFVRLDTAFPDAEPAPAWWKHVWRLFAMADEAACGTGFNFDTDSLKRFIEGGDAGLVWFEAEYYFEFATQVKQQSLRFPEGAWRQQRIDITTLSAARPEMLGVLPKVRTPSVGCTLRSLSHHLALTPGRGVARGKWTPNFVRPQDSERLMPDGQMNILLAPYPYTIEAQAFCGSLVERPPPDDQGRATKPRFGYFDVHQHWLEQPDGWENQSPPSDWRDALPAFVDALIRAAERHNPKIHALIFPELSLDLSAFQRVREHLEERHRNIELLIAGVSEKPMRAEVEPLEAEAELPLRHGNFVAVVSFNRGRGQETYRETIREKHHRWKLDADQLRSYGLLGSLSPEVQWWENIALQSRRVDFTVIRQRSVLSAMICEDLARVDPCQQLIRAVAPNLVVALLMDAPQRTARWPARYATVLAEDPGCAVLTLTSRGLMARQHRLGLYPSTGSDRIVAMWRDDQSAVPIELNCPYDAQGLLLTLTEEGSEDLALDGRIDTSAMAFRYAGHIPVRIPGAKDVFAHILGEEDRAC